MTQTNRQDEKDMAPDNQPATETPDTENETPSETVLQEDIPLDPVNNEETGDSTARIAELEAQVNELRDRMLRAVAEADNTRKRLERERQDTAKFAVSGFAKNMLTVADNLRRALEAIPEEARTSDDMLATIYQGVEATERELLRIFESNHIVKINPMDEVFDPNFHEVMFEAEMPDKPAGTVIQVIEPGYLIHERLLRPARVGVAKGGASSNTPAGGHVDKEV